ncbi:MAG: bifunctional enoyl-CoA hydratase/phosphate acetyltransferase [Eubacterium sp.]|nr:bifunctional enoyl-CoA hydratase/phosphate acetyltransferase [Eubacterium sp.]
MVFNSFKELAELVKQMPQKTKVAVVAAEDEHTLQAIAHAVEERLVEAVLIGKETKIAEILEKTGEKKENYEIVSAADPEESLQVAVKLVNDGICGAIMKGKLETGQLLKAILKKENNLRKGGLISLIGFFECPNYHKMFAVSDVAMNTYPDLDGKRGILQNAVDVLHSVGVENPKVAILCAVEKYNPKMQETVDAAALKEENEKGIITGCTVEGPISLDLAMKKDAAVIKGYESPVAGDADLLIVPDLVSGNLLAKALTELGGGTTGGLVVGAKVPVILVSRAASASDKFHAIALAAYVGGNT